MPIADVMSGIVADRSEAKGDSKHYIPFSKAEWAGVQKAFNRPNLKPNDVKLIILALCEGKLDLVRAEVKAEEAATKPA